MKNLITAFAFLTIASTTFAHEDARITSGKILELTTHRIDRLVVLKKVDPNFLKHLEKIQNILEKFRNILENSIISWKIPKYFEKFQNILENFQNILRNSKISWEIP